MLDIKKLFTKILVHITPTTIYNTKTTAPSTQSSYTYASVPSLANHDIVIVQAYIANISQNLIFCRNFGNTPVYLFDNNGTYIRGGFLVDWTNNRIGVRWVNGSSSNASGIYFQKVIGVL